MKNFKLDVNSVTQITSLFLWVFVLAGLPINADTTATDLVNSI